MAMNLPRVRSLTEDGTATRTTRPEVDRKHSESTIESTPSFALQGEREERRARLVCIIIGNEEDPKSGRATPYPLPYVGLAQFVESGNLVLPEKVDSAGELEIGEGKWRDVNFDLTDLVAWTKDILLKYGSSPRGQHGEHESEKAEMNYITPKACNYFGLLDFTIEFEKDQMGRSSSSTLCLVEGSTVDYEVCENSFRCRSVRTARLKLFPWLMSLTVDHKAQSEKLETMGRGLAWKVKRGEVTLEQFLADSEDIYPELKYFNIGCSTDVTPDATAFLQEMSPCEIEKRRTLGALLSAVWILGDKYEDFTRCQKDDKLSSESWRDLKDWTSEWVGLQNDIRGIDAMLSFMAIHDLGKLAPFRASVAGVVDHDDALAICLEKYPEMLPSYARLDSKWQNLILCMVRDVRFNFGQFLQMENLPGSLRGLLDHKGGKDLLAFYLFHIFVDMSGITGAKTLEGSLFMNEKMYQNFKLGMDTLCGLKKGQGVVQVYDSFLRKRAERLALEQPEGGRTRALARLACLCRSYDAPTAKLVKSEFEKLPRETQASLEFFLNAYGTTEDSAGFLLYYAPAFLENARKNSEYGLRRAFITLAHVFQQAAKEYPSVEKDPFVVEVHVGELAAYARDFQGRLPSSQDSVLADEDFPILHLFSSRGKEGVGEAVVKIITSN